MTVENTDSGSVASSSPPANDEHYFHSPLNSNAVVTIVLKDDLPLADLKSKYLSHHSNYEILSLHDSTIKLKFFNKAEAQELTDELTQDFNDINLKINYDTLTHPGNIYVRGLVPEVTTQDLFEIFQPFGEITSCKICFDEFGQSKSYGFINFTDGDSADAAIEKLNGLLINGSKFYLNHHIAKKERIERLLFEKQNFTNLYVKNIPNSYDEAKITELFQKFGDINSLFLPEVENSNPSAKKFGFINYKNHESAVEAILNLDNKELEPGTFLSVSRAQRRDERKSPLNIPPTLNIPIPTLLPSPNGHMHRSNQPPPFVTQLPPPPHSASSSVQTRSSYSSPVPVPFQFADVSGLPLPGPHQQQSNLYVKNLTQSITDDKLHSIFAQFGSIISAKIMTLEDGVTTRGFGFVCFKSVSEASRAMIAMNGSVIDGEVVHVSFAQKNNKKLSKNQYKPNMINGSNQTGNGFIQPFYYPGSMMPSNKNGAGVPYYYGVASVPSHNAQYDYIQQQQRFNNSYKPQLKKVSIPQQAPAVEESDNNDGKNTGLIEKINSLSMIISQLDSKDDKFDSLLKEIIKPSYFEYLKSNNIKKEEEELLNIAKTFLNDLLKKYDAKYDEILNDLSNEELNLSEEFAGLKI